MKLIKYLLLVVTVLCFEVTYAQKNSSVKNTVVDTANIQQITLNDGSVIFGYIVNKDEKGIEVKTKMAGTINLEWSKIEEIEREVTENKTTGKVWMKNANETRYVIGPSAIPLKKREGYYQNTYVLLNSFNVGLTNHISVGGGFEILSLFIRDGASFNFFLTPKVGFKAGKKLYLGGGALHVNMRQYGPDGRKGRQNFNVFYGSLTFGTNEHNFTVSGGFTYYNYTNYEYHNTPVYDSWGNIMYYNYHYTSERKHEFNQRPIITFSGMTRVGRKLSLLTENWVIPSRYSNSTGGYEPYFSYGVRILGEKTSFDLGFINNGDIASAIFIGIPYANFVVKF